MSSFFKDKTVLVTGGAGLIGSNLIARLAREGAQVRATCHRKQPASVVKGVEYATVDLTQQENCRAVVKGVDFVCHCAANTSGAATMASTPMVHVTPNVVMNALLLEAAYEAKVQKFLWLSSTTGYPDTGGAVTEAQMFEGEPFEKYFFVGWMKRFTEVLCRMYGEKLPERMPTIVLRPSNVYGPGDKFDPKHSHVTAALIRKVVERQQPLEVWGTGEDVRDLIYVDDMVDAMLLALEKLDNYCALNVGLGKSYTVKEALRFILEADRWLEAKVVFDPSKPTMIPVRRVDVTKAEKVLGFRAKVDLPEGIGRTLEWYRAERELPRPS